MALSDWQFIYIFVAIVAAIISIGGTALGLAYRIGKKSGETEQKINSLTDKVNEEKERVRYIERIFMNNSPIIAGGMMKRFSLTEGEKQQ